MKGDEGGEDRDQPAEHHELELGEVTAHAPNIPPHVAKLGVHLLAKVAEALGSLRAHLPHLSSKLPERVVESLVGPGGSLHLLQEV